MKEECVTRKQAEDIANSAVSNGVLTVILLLVVVAVVCVNFYAAWRLDALVMMDHASVAWAQLVLVVSAVALLVGMLSMLAKK